MGTSGTTSIPRCKPQATPPECASVRHCFAFRAMSGLAGHTYVPVDFRYATGSAPPPDNRCGEIRVLHSPGHAAQQLWRMGGDERDGGIDTPGCELGGTDGHRGQCGQPRRKDRERSYRSRFARRSGNLGTAGATPGSVVYGALSSPVTLNAYSTYYILSQESQDGDYWYDLNTSAQTRNDAT